MSCLYLVGQRFGRLVVLSHSDVEKHRHFWTCQCDCGWKKRVSGTHLTSGAIRSCGCLGRESARKVLMEKCVKHGGRYTRLYSIWTGMKKRCHYPRHKYFYNYGGRGISVCEAWRFDFAAFQQWALANGYAPGLTIDRIDVDGNYEPGNCRWATRSEQEKNKWRGEVRRRKQADAPESRAAA
jgi:hypothetical protein